MIIVDDDTFQRLINEALEALPGDHAQNIKNVAILYEDDPTPEQRETSHLRPFETLLGLYEGVPLTRRNGLGRTLPDKITLFKNPLSSRADSEDQLREEIKHTLWHEIAHYYGLDHEQIHGLE